MCKKNCYQKVINSKKTVMLKVIQTMNSMRAESEISLPMPLVSESEGELPLSRRERAMSCWAGVLGSSFEAGLLKKLSISHGMDTD